VCASPSKTDRWQRRTQIEIALPIAAPQEYGGVPGRGNAATDVHPHGGYYLMQNSIETGWREFLDRLKRLWGKTRGGVPTPALS